jgi:hypothetical protein
MYPSQPEPGLLPGAAFCSTFVDLIQKIAADTAKIALTTESHKQSCSFIGYPSQVVWGLFLQPYPRLIAVRERDAGTLDRIRLKGTARQPYRRAGQAGRWRLPKAAKFA